MLTFLRKVRKSLINSGSTRKYLLYAIGEILLVMIGILLALQVNNWNESRKDSIQYKKYLNGLIKDINADIENLVRNERGNNHYERAAQNLKHIHQSDQNFKELELEPLGARIKSDTLLLLLSIQRASFMVAPTINKFTIEDIKSSGKTSIIKNEDLKREIFNYYSRLGWYDELWQGKLRAKYALDDVKLALLDPTLLNLSNLDSTERVEVLSNYKINPDNIINGIRSQNDLLLPLNTMIYTMKRISSENLGRIKSAKEMLAKLEEEKVRLR